MKCRSLTQPSKISTLSNSSSVKKTQKSTFDLLMILLYTAIFSITTATISQARDVTLQWDPSTDSSVTGYKIEYNADSATVPFTGTGAAQGASPYDAKKVTTA
ncbi:MAG: hypothetical protein PHH28_16310, partial [Desulfuromonadaceae bacterium]|nr:hypothetical protein [Desulfuromonadaceae bacterium]